MISNVLMGVGIGLITLGLLTFFIAVISFISQSRVDKVMREEWDIFLKQQNKSKPRILKGGKSDI